jgi:hypothetical protein
MVSADAKAVESTITAPKAESFEQNFIVPPEFRIERALLVADVANSAHESLLNVSRRHIPEFRTFHVNH